VGTRVSTAGKNSSYSPGNSHLGYDMNDINKYLSKMAGDNQSNMNVKPGAKVPFMVIFSNLPDNIEEYRIQIEGSVPAEK
jgi:hypothetical protein